MPTWSNCHYSLPYITVSDINANHQRSNHTLAFCHVSAFLELDQHLAKEWCVACTPHSPWIWQVVFSTLYENFLHYFKKLDQKNPFSSCEIPIHIIHKMKSFSILLWRGERTLAWITWQTRQLAWSHLVVENFLQLVVPTSFFVAKHATFLWKLPKDYAKFSPKVLWAPL